MFIRSAAADTLQGRAIQNVNKQWGEDFRKWNGRETIGIPVCKEKYAPFTVVKKTINGKNKVELNVQRMYGCHVHSHLRKKVIEQHGERKGWEPFGQWSLSKARAMARRAEDSINSILEQQQDETEERDDSATRTSKWKHICHNGSCAWKMKGKFDDISDELVQESQALKAA